MPKQDDLFVKLSGGKNFTKLDLSHAYNQVELEPTSRNMVTINTHKGLFRPIRLVYGVSPVSAIFQTIMDQTLQGLDMVMCQVDDILVTGKNDQERLRNLGLVLTRLAEAGLRLKHEKCRFMQASVTYLGYIINLQGVCADSSKADAIKNASAPKNVQELCSFLGCINYNSKFIDKFSEIAFPLNLLLRKGQRWCWSDDCQNAFDQLKTQLASERVLTHYDPKLPFKLDADASFYGTGAVLPHIMPDGNEQPIAYASKILKKADVNDPQLEKEALSIIFGLKKFHKCLYARKFRLVTDHKPLTTLLGPKSAIPTLAAPRLQRWALLLSAHQYVIEYRPTSKHANADCFQDSHNKVVPCLSSRGI